jgi:hypothetical protein
MRAASISFLSTASWLAVMQAVPVGIVGEGTARTIGIAQRMKQLERRRRGTSTAA